MGFAEELRNSCAADWNAAVGHGFVDRLLDGSLPDSVLRHYLMQDYQFCDAFVALLGQAVASAPSLPSRLAFAGVLGAFASDENSYFQDCFKELAVPEAERNSPELTVATQDFDALMRRALDTRSYPDVCCGAAGGRVAVRRLGGTCQRAGLLAGSPEAHRMDPAAQQPGVQRLSDVAAGGVRRRRARRRGDPRTRRGHVQESCPAGAGILRFSDGGRLTAGSMLLALPAVRCRRA